MFKLIFDDVDGDRVEVKLDDGLILVFPDQLCVALDQEKAAWLASVLSHFAKTGELAGPTGELNSIGEVRGAALKKLEQDVATLREDRDTIVECLRALGAAQGWTTESAKFVEEMRKRKWFGGGDESTQKELRNKPKPYGLWSIEDEYWYTGDPFESAGAAMEYASKWFYRDWRDEWRVYEYPEDGGKPMELREDAQ